MTERERDLEDGMKRTAAPRATEARRSLVAPNAASKTAPASDDDARPSPIFAEGTAPVTAVRGAGRTDLEVGSLASPAVVADGTRPVTRAPVAGVWPSVAAVALLAGGTGAAAYAVHARAAARASFEDRYPVRASAGDRDAFARDLARWSRGRDRLLAHLARFTPPPLATLTGAGACPLLADESVPGPASSAPGGHALVDDAADPEVAIELRAVVLPDEARDGLDALARPEVDALIAAGTRGRFRSDAGYHRVRAGLAGGFTVILLDELVEPGQATDTGDRGTGHAAGTAYVLDPGSGAVRCAGAFRVESKGDGASLEAATVKAITASVRAID